MQVHKLITVDWWNRTLTTWDIQSYRTWARCLFHPQTSSEKKAFRVCRLTPILTRYDYRGVWMSRGCNLVNCLVISAWSIQLHTYIHTDFPFFLKVWELQPPFFFQTQDGPAQWACAQLAALKSGRHAQVAEEVWGREINVRAAFWRCFFFMVRSSNLTIT